MIVTIQLGKVAYYIIDCLQDEGLILKITKQYDMFTLQFRTPDYMDIVSRYSKASGVHSILLEQL